MYLYEKLGFVFLGCIIIGGMYVCMCLKADNVSIQMDNPVEDSEVLKKVTRWVALKVTKE